MFKYKYKTITTIHDVCYFECKHIYKLHTYIIATFFFKQALNYSKSIITVSYTTEKKLKDYFTKYKFKIKPIEIIYNVFQYDQSSDCKLNSSLCLLFISILVITFLILFQ